MIVRMIAVRRGIPAAVVPSSTNAMKASALRIKACIGIAFTKRLSVMVSVVLMPRPVPRLLRTLTLTLKEPLWRKPEGG